MRRPRHREQSTSVPRRRAHASLRRPHLGERLLPLEVRQPTRAARTRADPGNRSCLISGPSETPFEGGVFEAELKFPRDYPLSPPKVRLSSPDSSKPPANPTRTNR